MKYSIQYIADTIREERLRKGISQRDLSSKTGIPQGHISKIERGIIDLQVSTFIELARALELELMLIPRSLVPAITALKKPGGKEKQKPMYPPDETSEDEVWYV